MANHECESTSGEYIKQTINPYNAMEAKGFSDFKSSQMSWLVLSASFEYLCYGSTAIIHLLILSGTIFKHQNLISTDLRLCRLKTVPALQGLTLVLRDKYSFKQVSHQV